MAIAPTKTNAIACLSLPEDIIGSNKHVSKVAIEAEPILIEINKPELIPIVLVGCSPPSWANCLCWQHR
jgi:hypothetical protein